MKRIIALAAAFAGALAVLFVAVAGGLIAWTLASSPDFDSEFHPFRSPSAKARFLALYDEGVALWPVESDTVSVATSYGPTFVRLSGPDSGPPLVLLHGAGGNALHWIPNVAAWAPHFRVYAVDAIADYGRSVYTRPITSAADYVAWLDELLTALGLRDGISVVGLSYGGWQASQYALAHPERLDRIVLLAPAGTVLPLSGEFIRRALPTVLPHRYFTHSFMLWLLDDLAQQGDSGRRLVQRESDGIFLARASYKPLTLVNPHVLTDEELRGIAVPTLFVVGENEKIYPAAEAIRRLNTVAPHIETALVSDAGHDLSIAQASVVNQLVRGFLRRR